MKGLILFAGIFLLIVLVFGYLLRKEYRWYKSAEAPGAAKPLLPFAAMLVTAAVGIGLTALFGFYAMFSVAMYQEAAEQAKIVNLNTNTEVLAVGDPWNVDGLGSVTVKDVKELSLEEAKQRYGITPEDTEKYYELSFDYENIAFDGYVEDEKVIEDTMMMTVYVCSLDKDGHAVEAWLDTVKEKDAYYAVQGNSVTDNKFLIIAAEELERMHSIEISFTIYTTNQYERYRQVFLYEVAS